MRGMGCSANAPADVDGRAAEAQGMPDMIFKAGLPDFGMYIYGSIGSVKEDQDKKQDKCDRQWEQFCLQ